ncbi:biotin--[acetyl-CoA-carboxylase] ligase [Aegicerativicinus sediminis]
MFIIKLNAIGSTNSYLRNLYATKKLEDFTVVMAQNQTEGRGQMGSEWSSESGKNLTISVFKRLNDIRVYEKFSINMAVSMSIIETLAKFQIKNLSVKWPNDILSEGYKIGGILIENVIKHNEIKASIIGIGLNVNQTQFENIPRASSLRLISGLNYNLEELLSEIVLQLQRNFKLLHKNPEILKDKYVHNLFRLNKPSTFEDVYGSLFTGYIKGISDYGYLQVMVEDEIIKEFDLKEVKLLY